MGKKSKDRSIRVLNLNALQITILDHQMICLKEDLSDDVLLHFIDAPKYSYFKLTTYELQTEVKTTITHIINLNLPY